MDKEPAPADARGDAGAGRRAALSDGAGDAGDERRAGGDDGGDGGIIQLSRRLREKKRLQRYI